MEYKFTEDSVEKKNLSKSQNGIYPFLLENNINQLEQIINFLQNEKRLLLVNGFIGTGKAQVVNQALTFASKDTISLKYSCFETTILDDILLEFFDEFRKLTAQNIISIPKAKSENFTQKINAYFQSIEKPIIIVINAFEEILKNNKPEILGFILHLLNSPKIKIILTARVFDINDFEGKIQYEKIAILALSKPIFEKMLRAEDLKQIGPISDEFYKYTRGYFFYVMLSIKIMRLRGLSLTDFLTGYTKSFLSYNDFILREALSLVDPISGHLFRFLTIMRHPISVKLLMTLHLYDEEKINFFVENMVLTKDETSIYLQNYYKDISENSITDNIRTKLHKGCVELYNTQLPLKPLERDLLISRQTMRCEIEYHNMFLPKQTLISQKQISGAEFYEYGSPKKTVKKEEALKVIPIGIDTKQEKDEKLKNMSFIFESEDEKATLNKIVNSIENFVDKTDKEKKEDDEIKSLQLIELVNLAKKEEQNYNFKRVVSIYNMALGFKSDDEFYTFLPTIYTKLAYAYQNLSDWFNALRYYESALKFFNSTGDIQKVHEIKLNIANIHYITFKHEKATDLLNEILENQNISATLKIKTYILLASVCENNADKNKVYEYYKKAVGIIDLSIEKSVLSELYFKFGLILDEHNEPEIALKYYKKCIDNDKNPKTNVYMSSSLTNMATLYDEHNKSDLAIKYLQESLKIDEHMKNFNGIYVSAMKLGEINSRKDDEKSLEYFKKAKSCAIELNEVFYIASSNISLGDFYYSKKDNIQALRHYVDALKSAENNFNKDNIEKIKIRIADIKAKIGEERFKELEKEIGKDEKQRTL